MATVASYHAQKQPNTGMRSIQSLAGKLFGAPRSTSSMIVCRYGLWRCKSSFKPRDCVLIGIPLSIVPVGFMARP
jgi:hypothetical protein